MNELFKLDSNTIRSWLENEGRKQSWLLKQLGVSRGLLDQMLYHEHIPKTPVLAALAQVIGMDEYDLIIPRRKRRRAA